MCIRDRSTPSLELYGSQAGATFGDLRVHNWGDSSGDYWQINSNLGLDSSGNTDKVDDSKKGAGITIDGRQGRIFLKTSHDGTSVTNNVLIGDSSGNATFGGNINASKSSTETAWGSKSLPAADSGLYVNNPNTTNGTYASLGVITKNSSSTDQSFSIVAESLAGGHRPNVYFSQRSGANAQTSAITIDSAGAVHINHDGSGKLTSTGSGVTVTGTINATSTTTCNTVFALSLIHISEPTRPY